MLRFWRCLQTDPDKCWLLSSIGQPVCNCSALVYVWRFQAGLRLSWVLWVTFNLNLKCLQLCYWLNHVPLTARGVGTKTHQPITIPLSLFSLNHESGTPFQTWEEECIMRDMCGVVSLSNIVSACVWSIIFVWKSFQNLRLLFWAHLQ